MGRIDRRFFASSLLGALAALSSVAGCDSREPGPVDPPSGDAGPGTSGADAGVDGSATPMGDTLGALVCPTLVPLVRACETASDFDMSACMAAYDAPIVSTCPDGTVEAFRQFVEGGGGFSCQSAGGQSGLYPDTSSEDVNIGMFCPISIALCTDISCSTGSDCPGFPDRAQCNEVVERCVPDDGYCPALPCATGSDCPGFPATDCNAALGICI